MGLMKNGQWLTSDEARAQKKFDRESATFRNWITPDGPYEPAPDRYHLYVSLACPWASRTVIVRKLRRLESVIGMTVVDPVRDERGWAFREGNGYRRDPVEGFDYLSEGYVLTDPVIDGRVTVPVSWDTKTRS